MASVIIAKVKFEVVLKYLVLNVKVVTKELTSLLILLQKEP
jgi:hypothetical protein